MQIFFKFEYIILEKNVVSNKKYQNLHKKFCFNKVSKKKTIKMSSF
jgi:hypothetical protein